MSNSIDNINRLLRGATNQGDASEKIRKAAENDPAVARAIGNLTEKDLAEISAILNDKQALRRIMSTPKAQALLRKFKG